MLFNSDWDAMRLSPLEAMAYGAPLLASVQQGGLKEIVNKEDYGFLIPNHDVGALAGKIIYFLQNPDEVRKVGLAGRHRVDAISNTEQHAKQMESLIQGTDLSENDLLGMCRDIRD